MYRSKNNRELKTKNKKKNTNYKHTDNGASGEKESLRKKSEKYEEPWEKLGTY